MLAELDQTQLVGSCIEYIERMRKAGKAKIRVAIYPGVYHAYEGTNGVQAMDLVGRKLALNGGRGVRALLETIAGDIAAAKAAGDPGGIADPLEKALGHLQGATMWLAQNGMADPDNAGAGAYAYMQLMGLVTLGWMWLKMATVSAKLRDAAGEDRAFHDTKIATARFFAERELVSAGGYRRKVEAGAGSLMALPVEAF